MDMSFVWIEVRPGVSNLECDTVGILIGQLLTKISPDLAHRIEIYIKKTGSRLI